MRLLVAGVLGISLLVLGYASNTSAVSLKIAPLEFRTELKKAEVKKGFFDVSNPEGSKQKVKLTVQAFRQIDDKGSLEFFDSEQVSAGVRLDLQELELDPRESHRVYFLLDGAKLPEGDVYGAIFASTVPESANGAEQAVRVGTLLSITNATPGSRIADVTKLDTSWLQIGDGLEAKVTLRNPASQNTATGFYPVLKVTPKPYGSTTVKGPLIFAGHSRDIDYRQTGNYFGPLWLDFNSNGLSKGKFVFAVTGYWRWLAPLAIVLILLVGILLIKLNFFKRR